MFQFLIWYGFTNIKNATKINILQLIPRFIIFWIVSNAIWKSSKIENATNNHVKTKFWTDCLALRKIMKNAFFVAFLILMILPNLHKIYFYDIEKRSKNECILIEFFFDIVFFLKNAFWSCHLLRFWFLLWKLPEIKNATNNIKTAWKRYELSIS